MIAEIKNGHKYQLSMESDSLTFSGGVSIEFALPLPTYNGVGLRRIYQKMNLTSLYYEDILGNESVFSYPFTLNFFVLHHSSSTSDIIGQYMTELYCDKLVFAPNISYNSFNLVYGDDTIVQFTANEGYKLPSTISVINGTYTWDGDTGILTIRPSGNTTNHVSISMAPIQLLTITANTPNSYLSNTQKYIESGNPYTTKVVSDVGYKITNVVVTMGGIEQIGVYNSSTQMINIPNVTNDIVINVTTAVDVEPLTMYLYKNSSEPIRVDKSNYLTLVGTISGTFRVITDITHPIIDIEYNNVPEFNYVYINHLKRYYYVSGISSVSKNIWRITMDVDVLMTNTSKIREQTAIVGRNEFDYDEYIIDDMFTDKNRSIIQVEEFTNDFFFTDITYRYQNTYQSGCPVIAIASGTASYSGGAKKPTPDTSSMNLTKLMWEPYGEGLVTLYVANPMLLSKYLTSGAMEQWTTIFQDVGEYIISCKFFPFDATKLAIETIHETNITIGGHQTGTFGGGYNLGGTKMNRFNNIVTIATISFPRHFNDFRDYAPYTKINIFLPYISFVELPVNEVMGKTGIEIKYSFDLIDGSVQAFIMDGLRIIKITDKVNISLELPLNQKNNSERIRNLFLGSMSLLKGGIDMNVGNVKNASTEISKSGSSFLGALTERFTKGSLSGGWQTLNSPTSVYVVYERVAWVDIDIDKFAHAYGRPLNKSRILSDLSGFTKVSEIHLEGFDTSTSSELDMIENELKNGVIL